MTHCADILSGRQCIATRSAIHILVHGYSYLQMTNSTSMLFCLSPYLVSHWTIFFIVCAVSTGMPSQLKALLGSHIHTLSSALFSRQHMLCYHSDTKSSIWLAKPHIQVKNKLNGQSTLFSRQGDFEGKLAYRSKWNFTELTSFWLYVPKAFGGKIDNLK